MSERRGNNEGMSFKAKAGLTVAAGLTALAAMQGARAVESRGGVTEVLKSVAAENTERQIDKIKRESLPPKEFEVGNGEGLAHIYNRSGWNDGSIDYTYFEEAVKSLPENEGIDFNNLKPNQKIMAFEKLNSAE